MSLNVFDDHDGVVDNTASCQGDPKQRQCVDGEAQRFNENECADQGNWNRDGGNYRGTPILQEHEDDNDHQRDCFQQGSDHVFDGICYNIRRIEGDVVLQSRRKTLREPLKFGQGLPIYFERVRI